jgi:hypothetical protein
MIPEPSAYELGRMTDDQLDAIEHCRLCLEPYRRCCCKEGRKRRAAELEDVSPDGAAE